MFLVGVTTVSAAEKYQVNVSQTVEIDEHGVCKDVTNDSAALDVFVPTKTAAEWEAFRNNPPTGVSLADCVVAPTFFMPSFNRGCGSCPNGVHRHISTWTNRLQTWEDYCINPSGQRSVNPIRYQQTYTNPLIGYNDPRRNEWVLTGWQSDAWSRPVPQNYAICRATARNTPGTERGDDKYWAFVNTSCTFAGQETVDHSPSTNCPSYCNSLTQMNPLCRACTYDPPPFTYYQGVSCP